MSLKCKLGLHTWNGCKCSECGKTRDEQHDWNGCECSKCNKTRDQDHNWKSNCEKCYKCGKTRENKHDWSKNCEICYNCFISKKNAHNWTNDCEICSECGVTRNYQHNLKSDCEKCSICGKIIEFMHNWSEDCEKCSICGKMREKKHDWSIDCEWCSECGKYREDQHDWTNDCEKCSKCGRLRRDKHIWQDGICIVCKAVKKEIIMQNNNFVDIKGNPCKPNLAFNYPILSETEKCFGKEQVNIILEPFRDKRYGYFSNYKIDADLVYNTCIKLANSIEINNLLSIAPWGVNNLKDFFQLCELLPNDIVLREDHWMAILFSAIYGRSHWFEKDIGTYAGTLIRKLSPNASSIAIILSDKSVFEHVSYFFWEKFHFIMSNDKGVYDTSIYSLIEKLIFWNFKKSVELNNCVNDLLQRQSKIKRRYLCNNYIIYGKVPYVFRIRSAGRDYDLEYNRGSETVCVYHNESNSDDNVYVGEDESYRIILK